MLLGILHLFVDIYFVALLGPDALAGVSAASVVAILDTAIAQILNVSSIYVASQAAGRGDRCGLASALQRSTLLGMLAAAALLLIVYSLAGWYMREVGATSAAAAAGTDYLMWSLPGLALQLAITPLDAVLRGIGIARPTVLIQISSVALNIALTPSLMFGAGPLPAMGVAGAGLASTLSALAGVLLLITYADRCHRHLFAWRRESYFCALAAPLRVGLPAGADTLVTFLLIAGVTAALGSFGAAAQGAFGLGTRITQALGLPMMAVTAALVSVIGQNLGAHQVSRAKESMAWALLFGLAIAAPALLFCQVAPAALFSAFNADLETTKIGAVYLRVVSVNFIINVVISVCVAWFQARGDTLPPLCGSFVRMLCYLGAVAGILQLSTTNVAYIWYASTGSLVIHAVIMCFWARRSLRQIGVSAWPGLVQTG